MSRKKLDLLTRMVFSPIIDNILGKILGLANNLQKNVAWLGFLALACLSACGTRPNMEGAPATLDESRVSDSSESGNDAALEEPTGQGDVASFGDSSSQYQAPSRPNDRALLVEENRAVDRGADKVRRYKVKEGDNLWRIADRKEVYGNGYLYPLLIKANQDLLKLADDLKVGMLLRVPRAVSYEEKEIAREEAMAGNYEGGEGRDGPLGPLMASASFSGGGISAAPANSGDGKVAKGGLPGKKVMAGKASRGGLLIWVLLALSALGGVGYWKLRQRRLETESEAVPQAS